MEIELILDRITQHGWRKQCISPSVLKQLYKALGLTRAMISEIRRDNGGKQLTMFSPTGPARTKAWIFKSIRYWKCEKCDKN